MSESLRDTYDGEPWSELQLWDLQNSLAHGSTIEEVAQFLCRSGTIDDVRRKADELGLSYRSEPLPPPWPTKRITKAEVVDFGADCWGVKYEFDDGSKEVVESDSKELAEFDARDRVGDPVPVMDAED